MLSVECGAESVPVVLETALIMLVLRLDLAVRGLGDGPSEACSSASAVGEVVLPSPAGS